MYVMNFCKAETVGKRIRAIREFVAVSQEELAEISGVSWNTIGRLEKHGGADVDNSVKLDNVLAVCAALGKQMNVDAGLVAAVVVGGMPLLAAFQEIAQDL